MTSLNVGVVLSHGQAIGRAFHTYFGAADIQLFQSDPRIFRRTGQGNRSLRESLIR